MDTSAWGWKGKNGSVSRLLYEPGNWGDFLKLSWLAVALEWFEQSFGAGGFDYVDLFAGGVEYPLGPKIKARFELVDSERLEKIAALFLEREAWPSAASFAKLFHPRTTRIFDADSYHVDTWRDSGGAETLAGASAWGNLSTLKMAHDSLVMLDPYDFMDDWETSLSLLVEKARGSATLLYLYNRSARGSEYFREYRAFRNSLESLTEGMVKRIGRVPADGFLPRAHHEMVFLAGDGVAARPGFDRLLAGLERETLRVAAVVERLAVLEG